MKRLFLVIHDYGMGGLWAIINARSAEEIAERFPFVKVLDARPVWMTDGVYNSILEKNLNDIDGEITGWVKQMSEDLSPL